VEGRGSLLLLSAKHPGSFPLGQQGNLWLSCSQDNFFQGQTPITPDPSTFGIIDAGGQKVPMAFAYWEREVTGQQVAALKAVLNEVKAVSEDQRIIAILVYVPTATHVHAGRYSAESSPEFIARVKSLQGNPSLEALSPIAKELGIELINLLPVFQAEAKRGRLLYYPFDTHWNAEGRRTAAAFVTSFLRR
jgi:hypothetical protein